MEIHERIQRRMAELGLKSVDLVARTGLTKGTISQWVNGRTSPSGENLKKLCRVLRCSQEWILFGVNPPDGSGISEPSNVTPVHFTKEEKGYPVISWVQAGEWGEAVDLFPPGFAEEWERTDCNVGDSSFWLKVKGDSMTSPSGLSIPDGYLILVDPDTAPENGSLVVAKLDDSDEATFKKLVIDAGHHYLKPLNPSYRTIEINGNCRIVGVVREVKLKM
jgi:SOS-response transcriptional repressor LexA